MNVSVNPLEGFWTAERVERLKLLRGKGWSAGAIAKELGTTRNAVTGKAKRLKLCPPDKGVAPTILVPKKPPSPKAKPPQPPAPDPVAESAEPVPFLERNALQCAAVLDRRGADGLVLFCGRPVVRFTSWCPEHFNLFTEPSKGPSDGKTRYRL